VKARLRVLRRVAAGEKPPEPRQVRVTVKKAQADALLALQAQLVALQNQMNALLIGILGGHGIAQFSQPVLNGLQLTVVDGTALAQWQATHQPPAATPTPGR